MVDMRSIAINLAKISSAILIILMLVLTIRTYCKISLTYFEITFLILGCFGYLLVSSIEFKKHVTKSEVSIKILSLLPAMLFISFILITLSQKSIFRGTISLFIFSSALGILSLYVSTSSKIKSSYVLVTILMFVGFISTFYLGGIIQYQDDPGAYVVMTKSIINHGKVTFPSPWYKYYKGMTRHEGIPLYNIWQAEILLIPKISEVYIQIVSTIVISFYFLVLTYVMFRRVLYSEKIAYLSMVLSIVYPISMKWTYVQDSRAFVMIFLLIGLFSYFSLESHSMSYIIILILSWFAILNSHYYYPIIFISAIFIPLAILCILPEKYGIKPLKKSSKWIIVLGAIAYISKISMYKNIFSIFVFGFQKLVYGGSIKNLTIEQTATFSLGQLLMYLPFLAFVMFTIIGFFTYIESFRLDIRNVKMFLTLSSIAILSIFVIKIGIYVLDPRRIFYFLGLIFGALSAIAIWRIFNIINSEKLRIISLFSIITILTFLSISSNLSNQLDPFFYDGEFPVLYYHTISEKYSMQFINNHLHKLETVKIYSDYGTISRYIAPMWVYKNHEIIQNVSELKTRSGYILFSHTALTKSFLVDPNHQYKNGKIPIDGLRKELNRALLSKNKIYGGSILIFSEIKG